MPPVRPYQGMEPGAPVLTILNPPDRCHQTMHVLLIEDDEILGDGLKAGIEQTGWVVDWVRDGDAAQRAFEREGFDLAVLDLGLPKRPGIDVLRWLRRCGNQVPVLILTATDGVGDRVTALDAGADDYVVKPFVNADAMLRPNSRFEIVGARDSGLDTVLHAVALSLDEHGLGVVQEAVEQSRGQGGIVVEDLRPVLVGAVGGDDGAALLVA